MTVNLSPVMTSGQTGPKQELTYFQVQLEEEPDDQARVEEGLSSHKFRKNSTQKVETVSEFKIEEKKTLSPADFDVER